MIQLNHIILSILFLLLISACEKEEPQTVATASNFPPIGAMYGMVDSNSFIAGNVNASIANIDKNKILTVFALNNNSGELIRLNFYPFEFRESTYDLLPTHEEGNQFLYANYQSQNGITEQAQSGLMTIYSFEDSIARGFYDFITERGTAVNGRFTVRPK